jgi:4a-hydroxytetrahydrobiopterin dehydratase
VSTVELALDTPDHARIKPFWRAVLGYRDHPRADDEVRNDDADLPMLWFQSSGSDEPRQRFHLDVRVPPEVAQQRIDAAVAAGGRVVDEAASFVVLADADGNRVCVCS